MHKKLSLRLRLTLMSIVLSTGCCILLTIILNYSADKMANDLEATLIQPARTTESSEQLFYPPMDIAPSVPTMKAKQSFRTESIVAVVIIISVSGMLTYWLSARTLRPVKKLNAQINNTTIHNLLQPVDLPETGDEITALASSFNEMTSRLNDAFQAQSRFSASAAHELRTPLAVIRTKIDVFRKRSQHSIPEYDALINSMDQQSKRLSDIVTNLMTLVSLSETETNSCIQLDCLIQSAADEFLQSAHEHTVVLSCQLSPVKLYGNQVLLHQLFCNLIENAIRYNKPSGSVTITLYPSTDNNLTVAVSDTGIGMEQSHLPLLTEPFYCVDKSRSRKNGGAGLGLSLVDAIVKLHGGTLHFNSDPGKGTTVTVTFPLS